MRVSVAMLAFAVTIAATAGAGVYETHFNLPDNADQSAVRDLLAWQDGLAWGGYEAVPGQVTMEILDGVYHASSATGVPGFEDQNSWIIFVNTYEVTEPTTCELTMARSTVEDVRDGVLPEGLFSGMWLFHSNFMMQLSFGVLRRPAEGIGDRIARDGANEASIPRQEGHYVVFGTIGSGGGGTLYGAAPIPASLEGDVVFRAETADGVTYRFYVDDDFLAEVALENWCQGFGFNVQNFSDTNDLIGPFSGIAWTRLRMEGELIPDLFLGDPDPPDAVGEQGVITANPGGWLEAGGTLALTAPEGSGHSWYRDDVLVTDNPPRLTGAGERTLVFSPLLETDTGVYTCFYDDGTGTVYMTAPYALEVLPESSLPAPGALAVVLALGSAVLLRRRLRG